MNKPWWALWFVVGIGCGFLWSLTARMETEEWWLVMLCVNTLIALALMSRGKVD